jgi:serine/threonine protein kinase
MSAKILRGHYKILKPLSSGGFGKTFLAQDTDLPGDPTCVVKMLKPMTGSKPELIKTAQRLFNKEAETLYKLGNHDQIPRLMAHFEQSGRFFLVQEYVEGKGLNKLLTPGRQFPQQVVLGLLRNILQVLDFVHDQQVIHRDIKPANLIMRKADRKVVLIDFGAVKEMSGLTLMDSGKTNLTITIGTPGYMPSEQLAGKPRYCSDLYALGMVALQALTGTDPADLPEDAATAEIKWRDRLGDNYCHPILASIIDKMVRYDFRNRYQTASTVLLALDELQNNVLASKSFASTAAISNDLAESETVVTANQGVASNTGNIENSATANDNEATVVSHTTAKQYESATQANSSVSTQVSHTSQVQSRRIAPTVYTNRKPASRAKAKQSANALSWGLGAIALVGMGGLGTFWLTRSPQPPTQVSVQDNELVNPTTNPVISDTTANPDASPAQAGNPTNPTTTEPSPTPNPVSSPITSPQTQPQITIQETNDPPAAAAQSTPATPVTTSPNPPTAPTTPVVVPSEPPQSQPAITPPQSTNPLLAVNPNTLLPPQIDAMVASYSPLEALALIDQAIAAHPNAPALHIARGSSLRQLGRHAEAKAAMDKALALGAPPPPNRPGLPGGRR